MELNKSRVIAIQRAFVNKNKAYIGKKHQIMEDHNYTGRHIEVAEFDKVNNKVVVYDINRKIVAEQKGKEISRAFTTTKQEDKNISKLSRITDAKASKSV